MPGTPLIYAQEKIKVRVNHSNRPGTDQGNPS